MLATELVRLQWEVDGILTWRGTAEGPVIQFSSRKQLQRLVEAMTFILDLFILTTRTL
jgi:hypothetical protein